MDSLVPILLTALAAAGMQDQDGRNTDTSDPTMVWAAILLFIAGSIVYVYRFRGRTRYPGFGAYFRKSWPIFAPFNCLLYLFTRRRARGPVLSAAVLPDLALLQANWQVIRDEARALQAQGEIDASAAPGSPGYYDVGFRTFYKYGWRKFYLCWYGYTHRSALRTCPKTVELLSRVHVVKGAMFSFLPAGGELTQHSDPLACSLRYHLGLDAPGRDDCFIEIDGVRKVWANGEDFLFDETYPHHARNDSTQSRLILMCDVERPLYLPGRIFNWFYSSLARLTVVPNTAEDRRGFASSVFAEVTPLLQRSKALKEKNRTLYRVLKTVVNSALLCILLGALFIVVQLAGMVV